MTLAACFALVCANVAQMVPTPPTAATTPCSFRVGERAGCLCRLRNGTSACVTSDARVGDFTFSRNENTCCGSCDPIFCRTLSYRVGAGNLGCLRQPQRSETGVAELGPANLWSFEPLGDCIELLGFCDAGSVSVCHTTSCFQSCSFSDDPVTPTVKTTTGTDGTITGANVQTTASATVDCVRDRCGVCNGDNCTTSGGSFVEPQALFVIVAFLCIANLA